MMGEELGQIRSAERRKIWMVRQIRSRALKRRANPPQGDCAGLVDRVGALPEPDRSAFAVFHCMEGRVDDLAEMLRLERRAFAQALARARQALAPGVGFPGKGLMGLHRPWGGDVPRVARAVRKAQDSPEMAAQAAADAGWHAEIGRLPVPGEAVHLQWAEPPRPGLRALVFQPAVLAIVLALVVVMGVLVYVAQTRMGAFQGKEALEELVESVGTTGLPEYESVAATPAGRLDDWFVMKGFEGFTLPGKLRKARAAGCRVYRRNGMLLAEVLLEKRDARLIVFRTAEVKGGMEPCGWHIFQQEEWAVAVRADEERGCLVMFRGDADEMHGFLRAP